MANFPGSNNALPGVYTNVETFSNGLSIPSGVRLPVLMGEGQRNETIVASANGGGNDGLNPSYTGPNGADGRHFMLSNAPIVSNRTTIYKNGIPLTGTEGPITGTFSDSFDYRIDIDSGKIELQQAYLVDQGGSYYRASSLNVGNGLINSLTLVDPDAPSESWIIRCSSVIRDGFGDPIDGYAKFIATGSVSGTLLDGYGNQVFWMSNGTTNSNTILQFNVTEGASAFNQGDTFVVEVKGGTLLAGDSLTATYIAVADINDLQFFTDLASLTAKHGSPSLSNRLSLGAQLVFANGTPGTWACQTAPSLPRRVSYVVNESFSGGTGEEDLTFPLPLNVVPDTDSNINIFITNPLTGVDTQLTPNKTPFYNPTITANPYSAFINDPGYVFSYTVILSDAVVKSGNDAIITNVSPGLTKISSASVNFDISDLSVTRSLVLFNCTNPLNDGSYTITNVTNGDLFISATLTNESGAEFEVRDSSTDSAKILFTDDLAAQIVTGSTIRVTVVDKKDADFYDAGWVSTYEKLETIEVDIVVPLPSQTISVIFQNGATHVKTMSNIKNKKERVLFIGAIQGLDPANVIGTEPAAVEDIGVLEGIQGDDVTEVLSGNIEDLADYGIQNSYGNTYRIVYFYPDQIVMQIGADRTFVDGFFIAAAAAGYLSGVPNVAIPLTKKSLTGFTILRNKLFRPIVLEQLTAAGITVLQPILGGGSVIRGQTTTNSGYLEEREVSIVFIRDRVSKDLRTSFAGFIGQPESPIFESALVSRARATLNGFVNQGLITQYKDLKVQRDESSPDQFNVSVKIQPVYGINFIYIRVGVGLL